jgi:NIMA (never in mitosis gene a)-related kinase
MEKSYSNKYEVLATIGHGAFGVAVLVRRQYDGLALVIKKVNVQAMSSKEKADALQEVSILSKLKHEHVIAYHEAFLDRGNLNIVLDYADSGTLEDEVKDAQNKKVYIDPQKINMWFSQLAAGLAYVHQNKIVHRDIKTANIFLTGNDVIKIGDFGIAKVLATTAEMANTMVGTPYYLSPELCENRPYNSKSDVWALGCVMYELCTLKHAFNGGNMAALILNILRGNYDPLPEDGATCLDKLKKLIPQMLKRNAEERPSMKDINTDIVDSTFETLRNDVDMEGVAPVPPASSFLSPTIHMNRKVGLNGGISSENAGKNTPDRSASEIRQIMKMNLQRKQCRTKHDDPELSMSTNIRNRIERNQPKVRMEAAKKGLGVLGSKPKLRQNGSETVLPCSPKLNIPDFVVGQNESAPLENEENLPTYNARLSLGLLSKQVNSMDIDDDEMDVPTVCVRFSSGVGRSHSPRFSLQGGSL